MKGKWFVFASIFCFFILGTGFFHPCNADSKPQLRIIENDWPPFFFGKANNEHRGLAREILEACLSDMGYDFRFDFYPIKRMYAFLKDGSLDIALFSYKKSRESFVAYGKEPIFITGYRPVVLARKAIIIKNMGDFDRLRVGHLAGLKYSPQYFRYIEKRKRENRLVVATTGNSCLRMLLSDIIDIFVDTRETILWRAKQLEVTDRIRILNFDIRTRAYFVTVSRKSPGIPFPEKFLNDLDLHIRNMKQDGSYQKVAVKYGLK